MDVLSDIKSTEYPTFSASLKAFRKFDSDLPVNLDIISEPSIKKKHAPDSLATARAIKVLPKIFPLRIFSLYFIIFSHMCLADHRIKFLVTISHQSF